MEQLKYKPGDGFPYYFSLTRHKDLTALYSSLSTFEFLNAINEEKAVHRYAPGKWSIKQVVGHITDHERIKGFRAFQLSRNEKVQLWGYDQNSLVNHSRFEELSMSHLVTDFANVRQATQSFIEALSEKQLNTKGWANQHEITLEDFLKSIIGHELHHIGILKQRYIQS